MEKVILLMAVFTTCSSIPQDLSGKMLTFPKETDTDHVKLMTPKTRFQAVTACVRSFTDITRDYAIFSLATRTHINAFGIFKLEATSIRMLVQDAVADFAELSIPLNKWVSICGTWSSETGLTQVWLDGQPSSRRFIHQGEPLNEAPITILGQEQDSYGGGFDLKQSFVGMMQDVHMWDSVLSPCELRRYANNRNFTPGNVLNWRAMEFQKFGKVQEEDNQDQCTA
ncbi:C-reactive protein-like [Gadus macrocephalus]|uniref:C-reactive protein-like n=1 Tax=Gadus macrocephalus TaxID=80720 RepID=UPI0028CB63B4|nr:C-reactive protein-like [Gadus macrocephalus]